MRNEKEIKDQLLRLGLTPSQAKVYLLLLAHSQLRVQEIVNLAQIPRSSVYESLKGLFEMGLAHEVVEENFKIIRPDPLSGLKHRLQESVELVEKKVRVIDEVEKALVPVAEVSGLVSTQVHYYKGIAGARQLFWNTLKASTTVCVYSAYGRSKFVGKKFYMDFVAESKIRNIKEKVLVNPTPRFFELLKRDLGTPLARTQEKDIRTLEERLVKISGETFIYDSVYAQVYLDTEGISGFEIQSLEFTQTQRSIFETLYGLGKDLSVAT